MSGATLMTIAGAVLCGWVVGWISGMLAMGAYADAKARRARREAWQAAKMHFCYGVWRNPKRANSRKNSNSMN